VFRRPPGPWARIPDFGPIFLGDVGCLPISPMFFRCCQGMASLPVSAEFVFPFLLLSLGHFLLSRDALCSILPVSSTISGVVVSPLLALNFFSVSLLYSRYAIVPFFPCCALPLVFFFFVSFGCSCPWDDPHPVDVPSPLSTFSVSLFFFRFLRTHRRLTLSTPSKSLFAPRPFPLLEEFSVLGAPIHYGPGPGNPFHVPLPYSLSCT